VADVPVSDETGVPPDGPKAPGAVARLRTRGRALAEQATGWVEDRRGEVMPVDLAVQFYERDRDSFAAVLGAAIALRLFLFFVPVVLLITGLIMMIAGHDGVKSLADQAGVTGNLANQIDQATTTSKTTTYGLVLAGVWLTVWAGRSLTKVLAACSAGAWRLGGREGRATLRMAGSVTTMTFLLLLTAAMMNRIKDNQGIAVITTSWILAAVVYSVGWFLVTATLPRRTSDPGALIPGAVLVGGAISALQWFMQYYLPDKLAHTTALAGSVGASVAALGYMFLIGRVMASSLILDAVVFDRLGSISELVFALPVLDRIPRRFPSVARYFDLDREGADAGAEPDDPGPGPTPMPG
jgi:membrane protein